MIEIEAPDGTILEFPDDMAEADILKVMQREYGGPEAPQVEQPQGEQFSNFRSALEGIGQGITLNLSDEIEAGLRAPFSDKTYSELQKEVSQRHSAMAREDPFSYYGGNIAGAIAVPGGGAVMAARGAASGLGRAATGAGVGLLEGAIGGAGMSDQGERTQGALTGAAIGTVLGGGAGFVSGIAQKSTGKIINNLQPTTKSFSEASEDVISNVRLAAQKQKGVVQDAYKLVENSPGTVSKEGIEYLTGDLNAFVKSPVTGPVDPQVSKWLSGIIKRATPNNMGADVSLQQVEGIRKSLNRARSSINRADDAKLREMDQVIRRFDDTFSEMVASTFYKGPDEVVGLLKNARKENRLYREVFSSDKIISRLVGDDASPDQAVNWLMHVDSVTRNPAAIQALTKIKTTAPEAFNSIKEAAWQKMIMTPEGALKDGPQIAKYIERIQFNNPQLAKNLFGSDWSTIAKAVPELRKSTSATLPEKFRKLISTVGAIGGISYAGSGLWNAFAK